MWVCVYVCVCGCVCVLFVIYLFIDIQHAPFHSYATCFRVKYSQYRYIYRVIQKDGLNFVRQYFLNYTRYVNDLHNI